MAICILFSEIRNPKSEIRNPKSEILVFPPPVSYILNMRIIACAMLVALCAAGSWAAAPKTVIALETVPCYESPGPALLPGAYIDKKDSCAADSTVIDSTGAPWFRILKDGAHWWARAEKLRYAAEIQEDKASTTPVEENSLTMKSRRAAIAAHPEWPRRIKKAVHGGQICLDMSEEQLISSWGDPVEKARGFVLGVGEHDLWMYKGRKGEMLVVNVQNGRIIGWRE